MSSSHVLKSLTMFFSCQLVRNPDTGFHKHYGFVEYKEPKSMKEAIQAMNGFDLGGQLIRVGPCVGKFENITFLKLYFSVYQKKTGKCPTTGIIFVNG